MNFLQQLLKFFLNLFKAKSGNNIAKPQPARLPTTNTSKPAPSASEPVTEVSPSVAKPEKGIYGIHFKQLIFCNLG